MNTRIIRNRLISIGRALLLGLSFFFGLAHAGVTVGMPGTQAEQQAAEALSSALGIRNMAGESAFSNTESSIPNKYIKASANNSNSARLLGGLWTFIEESIYTDTYTFTTVD